jgi:hypothetical protein
MTTSKSAKIIVQILSWIMHADARD